MNKQDFESKYSGLEIDEVVGKGLGMNPENNGWIKLPSTKENPLDIDTVFNVGNYTTLYASGFLPPGLEGVSPLNFSVVQVPWSSDFRLQYISYADLTYRRERISLNPMKWSKTWLRSLASNYIWSNDEANPPPTPESGNIWIHPSADGKTMTMKVFYSNRGWRDLKAEGLMAEATYDPTGQKKDLFALIDGKFTSLQIDVTAIKAHMADKVIHITQEERLAWNDKVTSAAFATAKDALKTEITTQISTQTGQYEQRLTDFNTRITSTQNELKAHAANATIHVNATDKAAWNAKAEAVHSHLNDNHVTIDAKDVTSGVFDVARIPKEAFSDVVEVNTVPDMYKLTKVQVQNGDTVHVKTPSSFYFVVDDTKLTVAAGYTIYSVGVLDEIYWANIRNKPTTLAGFGITDAYTKADVDQKIAMNITLISGELKKHSSMINYVVANDVTQDVQDIFYPQENLHILQGPKRENQLFPYAESECLEALSNGAGHTTFGFNEWSVLPKYGTADISFGGIYSNQPYRIPKIPADYTWSSFKTRFPEEFVDETIVSVNYFHMDTAGKIQAGAPPQVPLGTGTDNVVTRHLGDWQQIYCGTDPTAPIVCKKIKSHQYLHSSAPYNFSSHICIICKKGDPNTGNACGHLAIAYENEGRNGIEIFENPFLAPVSSTTTDPFLLLKKRVWQGFMLNPNAANMTIGSVTSPINDATLAFNATPTNPTTDLDILLHSAGGFNVYDFDFDERNRTLVVVGSVRISMNTDNSATIRPRLTTGTKTGTTVILTRSVPAVLICDIISADQHPGAATVGQAITVAPAPSARGRYFVGLLPTVMQICPPSGSAANSYGNRFGLNFFENDAVMTSVFQSTIKSMKVSKLEPTSLLQTAGDGDGNSSFMVYADHHVDTATTNTPYPVGIIGTLWHPSANTPTATTFTLRRSVFATAELPEYWAYDAAKFPVQSCQHLPSFSMLKYNWIRNGTENYSAWALFGSCAAASDVFDGTICPWYIPEIYGHFTQKNTPAENSRLPNVKYRATKNFAFVDREVGNIAMAFRISDLKSDGKSFKNARDTYHFFLTPDPISSDNKYSIYILVNGLQNRWAAVRISYEHTPMRSEAVVYQETLDPLPADVIAPSMYPFPMKLINKTVEPPAPWNHFYQLPISDIGIIPYTIRPYDALLREDYGKKLREMTEAIDRQRLRTGVIWAKRGNLVEMTGMTTIISEMPMGAPYTDTAFIGTVNSEYYIGYITEYGEVYKRKLITGTSKKSLDHFHPRAIFSATIWYDPYNYGGSHSSPNPAQVGLLGYNDKNPAKCLERVNIPSLYGFVASTNESGSYTPDELPDGRVFIDTTVPISDTLCNNKEAFIKVIGGGLEIENRVNGDFSTSICAPTLVTDKIFSYGCQLAVLYNKPNVLDYNWTSDRNETLLVAGNSVAGRYAKPIDASVYNPTNITGKQILYRELIHSSDGVPVYFAICGINYADPAKQAVVIIPKANSATPEIIRAPWPNNHAMFTAGYFRSSHRWMYCGGKAYPCDGHPSFVTANVIFSVQILARTPKDNKIPRISIVSQVPVKLDYYTNGYMFGAIGQGNPGMQKNPVTNMDLAPIIIQSNRAATTLDSILVYQPPLDETDLPNEVNPARNDKNYFPVYTTTKLLDYSSGKMYQMPGATCRMYSYPGFILAKTRDLGIVGNDGSWYVTMTASRAMSEQINFGRMVQDAYTWKNQAQYQNTQIQSMWKTVHDAQPMLQSILNLI